jgi:hypothetical protein
MNIVMENYSSVSKELGIEIKRLGDRFTTPDLSSLLQFVCVIAPYHLRSCHADSIFIRAFLGYSGKIEYPFIQKVLRNEELLKNLKCADNFTALLSMIFSSSYKTLDPDRLLRFFFTEFQTEEQSPYIDRIVECLSHIAISSELSSLSAIDEILKPIINVNFIQRYSD